MLVLDLRQRHEQHNSAILANPMQNMKAHSPCSSVEYYLCSASEVMLQAANVAASAALHRDQEAVLEAAR